MPGSPKSAKGKLSKAERERLKKEEELQRQKEEEEARRAAAEEEKERLEREKAEAEKKHRLLLEERRRKAGQIRELEDLWDTNRRTLSEEQAEGRRLAKWARYMRCDGSPDPTIAGEINTYMNLWRENIKENSMGRILKESNLVLSLINELNNIIDTTPVEEVSEKESERYKQTQYELTELLQEKLDLASHDLLLHASELADPETSNLQHVVQNDVITLNMWGNLSKNPRIRSFEFEETGFTFDIPKSLALSDCAYRILFTKYDHLSPQCESYKPRRKEKPEPEPEPEGECEGEKSEDGEKKEEGKEGQAAAPAPPEKESTEKKKKELMATLRGDKDKKKEGKKEEKSEKAEEEEQVIDDLKTPEPEEWEDFDGDDDVVDLRAYAVLGGVFHFNLLHLPPQPKVVKSWTITQVIEPAQLTQMDYVADDAVMSAPSSAKESSREEGGGAAAKKEDRPPIGVTFKLPDNVYFSEEPQVVIWDPIRKLWSLDGFSDHDFREENRQITFKTCRFGTFALIQDSHINMPFQSWEIRPHGPNSALFTIIAAIVEVELEIKDGKCMLVVPEGKAELEHFKDNWVTPQQMIVMLRGSGVNVFPAPDSNRYVSIQNKHPVTEERLYQQMALTASSMAYSWSKWNSEIKNRDQIIVQGNEHLEDEPLLEEDWSLFMATKYRTIKLQMTEFDENFSDDHAEGTEYHADLYHLALELASDEGKERIQATSNKFIDSVYTLLKASRIITFS